MTRELYLLVIEAGQFASYIYIREYSIRQHTSAYVSIRQHTSDLLVIEAGQFASFSCFVFCILTSAYVSIRQRTSAYVSIRQH